MAHDVVDSRGRATSSRNGVTPGKGRYSKTVLTSRAEAATKVTKKYSSGGNSNDSYVDFVEERLRKLQEADRANVILINTLLGDYSELNLMLESTGNRKLTIDEMMALRAAMLNSNNNPVMEEEPGLTSETLTEESKELGTKAVSTIGSTVASGVNTVLGFGKGMLEGGEHLIDGYLAGKSKFDSMLASGIGKVLGALGIEGRRRIS